MTEFETWTLGLTFVIALSGWVFAAWQQRSNQKLRKQDLLLAARQRKVDRVLEQLDAYAELEDLYRLLATDSSRLSYDGENQLGLNEVGTPLVVRETFKPDPDLEQAVGVLEDTEDLKSAIALQVVRLHRKQSQSSDLLLELNSTGQVAHALSLLYVNTVTSLKRALESGDFLKLVNALENANKERTVIRSYVNYLAINSDIDSADLPPLPTKRNLAS